MIKVNRVRKNRASFSPQQHNNNTPTFLCLDYQRSRNDGTLRYSCREYVTLAFFTVTNIGQSTSHTTNISFSNLKTKYIKVKLITYSNSQKLLVGIQHWFFFSICHIIIKHKCYISLNLGIVDHRNTPVLFQRWPLMHVSSVAAKTSKMNYLDGNLEVYTLSVCWKRQIRVLQISVWFYANAKYIS